MVDQLNETETENTELKAQLSSMLADCSLGGSLEEISG